MTKRLITLLFAVIMLLTLIPAAAFADEDPFPRNVTIESENNHTKKEIFIENACKLR